MKRPVDLTEHESEGLVRRIDTGVRRLPSTTGGRVVIAGGIATGAVASVMEIANLAYQHPALTHAIVSGGYSTAFIDASVAGTVLYVNAGLQVMADRRSGTRRYSVAHRNVVAARMGRTARNAGILTAATGVSATVAHAAGFVPASGLVHVDALVACGAAAIALSAAAGSRLARGPRPKTPPALAE